MEEKRRAARWRKRRIIYNNDGDDALEARSGVEHNHDVAEALMTRKTGELTDDFLNARSTPLRGSQVDSNWYCSCMAGLTFSHQTKLGGFIGKVSHRNLLINMAETVSRSRWTSATKMGWRHSGR